MKIHGDNPVSSVYSMLKKMLEHVKKRGRKVLITIDEVDNSQEMKNFIQDYQSLLRQHYPVYLLMPGLYGNISKLQDDKSLTFLYRAPKIQLGPLSMPAILGMYKHYLNVKEDTAIQFAKMTKGYAYAYQVLGYLLFENKEKELNDLVLSQFDQYLSDYVYEKLYSELSEKEKEFVSSIDSDGEFEISKLLLRLGIDKKNLSVYLDRLIKRGLITPVSYGIIQFSLPRFSEFLKLKR